MIDPKLNQICKLVDAWCNDHHVQYDIVCDENDIQGIMLFKRNHEMLENLVRAIYPSILEGNIFVQAKPVRGGVVMAFSLNALTENRLTTMIEDAGQSEDTMTFRDKINSAFDLIQIEHKVVADNKTAKDIDFTTTAKGIVREAQRKTPTSSRRRGSLNRSSINDIRGTVKQSSNSTSRGARKGAAKGSATVSDDKQQFQASLKEALDGLATSDGKQPGELFKVFARALRVLGNKLGIGPLQDRLTRQGISWKQSDDGQSIVLTVKNADTNAEQPIASINYETLQMPSDFEEQLKNMLDLATGQAPGSFVSQEKEIQAHKKTIGDIARAIKPQDEQGEVTQLMNADMNTGQNAGAGQAALTAAMPKESLERRLDEALTPELDKLRAYEQQLLKTIKLLQAPDGSIVAINMAAYRQLAAKLKEVKAKIHYYQ